MNPTAIDLGRYTRQLNETDSLRWSGVVRETIGLVVESEGPAAALGDFCEIVTSSGRRIRTQVIGFKNGRVLSMPLEETSGLQLADTIIARKSDARLAVGSGLLGRVLDGFGHPIDGGPPIDPEDYYALDHEPPGPLEREPIRERLVTGVRAIDGFLTCGRGQRVGIFGGSGVGKSTLLGSLVKNNDAEVSVLALIGERNREVRDFIENELGEEGLKRSVVVVATSDRPAPLRIRALSVALAAAEFFRDQGKDVLVVGDSVTRLAMAQREIGLAAGEPPSQKGYTPSVFQLLPRVFERAGRFKNGSITAFFTVLVEGDDMNEPIADAVRGILDGHIVLSRSLGQKGHYPAIDVLQSVSRLAPRVAVAGQTEAANRIRETMALLDNAADLIRVGAYAAGSNPQLDAAIAIEQEVHRFLRQKPHETSDMEATAKRLTQLASSQGARPR